MGASFDAIMKDLIWELVIINVVNEDVEQRCAKLAAGRVDESLRKEIERDLKEERQRWDGREAEDMARRGKEDELEEMKRKWREEMEVERKEDEKKREEEKRKEGDEKEEERRMEELQKGSRNQEEQRKEEETRIPTGQSDGTLKPDDEGDDDGDDETTTSSIATTTGGVEPLGSNLDARRRLKQVEMFAASTPGFEDRHQCGIANLKALLASGREAERKRRQEEKEAEKRAFLQKFVEEIPTKKRREEEAKRKLAELVERDKSKISL